MTLTEQFEIMNAYRKINESTEDKVIISVEKPSVEDVTDDAAETAPVADDYLAQFGSDCPCKVIDIDIVTIAEPEAIGLMVLPSGDERAAFEDMLGAKLDQAKIRCIGQFVKDNACNCLSEKQIQEGIIKIVKGEDEVTESDDGGNFDMDSQFVKDIMMLAKSPMFSDRINSIDGDKDIVKISFKRFEDDSREKFRQFEKLADKFLPKSGWEFGSSDNELLKCEYIRVGGNYHDGLTPTGHHRF